SPNGAAGISRDHPPEGLAPSKALSTPVVPLEAERVLLLNPAVFDTRLHWARWQQPTLLLRLATWYRRIGAEVKLIDALARRLDERLRKERQTTLKIGGFDVHKWRYGRSRAAIDRVCRDLAKARWLPDVIYVECLTTFWWEGAAEAIE